MNKFEIVKGKENNQAIKKEKYIGLSIYKEDEKIYKIHLNSFPNISYYMKRNKKNEHYTIFSKKIKNEKGLKLLRPVGQGRIVENLKSHMQLNFDLLGTPLYMSLFPNN